MSGAPEIPSNAEPRAHRTALSARALGAGFTVLVHLGLLLPLLIGPWQEPEAEPAAQPPMQISLLAAPARSAPQPIESRPSLPDLRSPIPPELIIEPTAPPTPAPSSEATPAEPLSATPGTAPTLRRRDGASADCLPQAWLMQMSRAISFSLRYPGASRQRGERGTAYVRVNVARNGRVIDASLLRSSGYANLDFEARDVLRRIARFAPVPDSDCSGYGVIVIDQPVRFGG